MYAPEQWSDSCRTCRTGSYGPIGWLCIKACTRTTYPSDKQSGIWRPPLLKFVHHNREQRALNLHRRGRCCATPSITPLCDKRCGTKNS